MMNPGNDLKAGFRWILAGAVLLWATTVLAQQSPPTAAPADVESVDAILHAVYDVISGPAGEKRDWERFRSLFFSGARLIPVSKSPEGGEIGLRTLSPEDYIERTAARLETEGFFEQEIHRVVEQLGPIVHVFSTYESRRNADDARPFARGINSFQLLDDGRRWWIVTIYWTGERPDLSIPAKYLP